MARIRAFLGIGVSPAIRDGLLSWQRQLSDQLRDVQWVKPENWHITLIFLGDVSAEEVPAICREARTACSQMAPFQATVQRLGCFPDIRRPRIVWAGIGVGAKQLCELHADLGIRLSTLGFRQEERPLTPHITLGRRKGTLGGVKEVFLQQSNHLVGTMLVEEVQVYSSALRKGGSVYQVMGRARLGNES